MRAAPGLELGHALLAERARHAQPIGVDLRGRSGAVRASSSAKSGVALPFCSSATSALVKRAFGASAVTSSVAGLADDAIRFVDGERRRRAAPGDDIRAADDQQATSDHDEQDQDSQRNMDSNRYKVCVKFTGSVTVASGGIV